MKRYSTPAYAQDDTGLENEAESTLLASEELS
jgi:hypothetical protein